MSEMSTRKEGRCSNWTTDKRGGGREGASPKLGYRQPAQHWTRPPGSFCPPIIVHPSEIRSWPRRGGFFVSTELTLLRRRPQGCSSKCWINVATERS